MLHKILNYLLQQGLGPGALQWKSLCNPSCHWPNLGYVNLWPRFRSASHLKIGTGWIIYEMICKQKPWVGLLWFTGITLFMIFFLFRQKARICFRMANNCPKICSRIASFACFRLPIEKWLTQHERQGFEPNSQEKFDKEACATISISYSHRCSYTLRPGPLKKYPKRSLFLFLL